MATTIGCTIYARAYAGNFFGNAYNLRAWEALPAGVGSHRLVSSGMHTKKRPWCRRNFQPTVAYVPSKLGFHLGATTGLFLEIQRCGLFFLWVFFPPKARWAAPFLCAGYISEISSGYARQAYALLRSKIALARCFLMKVYSSFHQKDWGRRL